MPVGVIGKLVDPRDQNRFADAGAAHQGRNLPRRAASVAHEAVQLEWGELADKLAEQVKQRRRGLTRGPHRVFDFVQGRTPVARQKAPYERFSALGGIKIQLRILDWAQALVAKGRVEGLVRANFKLWVEIKVERLRVRHFRDLAACDGYGDGGPVC